MTTRRNVSAKLGHKEGAKTLEKRSLYKQNRLKYCLFTVYAFSTENWKRTEEEVSGLCLRFLQNYLDTYSKKAVQNI